MNRAAHDGPMTPYGGDLPAPAPDALGERSAEMTRDPVFLLQSAHLVVADPGYFDAADKMAEDRDLSAADANALVARGLTAFAWETESVWLTRKEAEQGRARRAHHWRYGSRVYCLCAEGALARLLAGADSDLYAAAALLAAPEPSDVTTCRGPAHIVGGHLMPFDGEGCLLHTAAARALPGRERLAREITAHFPRVFQVTLETRANIATRTVMRYECCGRSFTWAEWLDHLLTRLEADCG